MESFASRRPGFVARLQRLEDRTAHWPVVRNLGDHFLMVLKKS
jgi:hypothetical protein